MAIGSLSKNIGSALQDLSHIASRAAHGAFQHTHAAFRVLPPSAQPAHVRSLLRALHASSPLSEPAHIGHAKAPFWQAQPSLSSLLDQVRQHARHKEATVPAPPESSHEALAESYRPVFEALNARTVAPLDLTVSERWLLDETHHALYGEWLPMSVVGETGRLGPALERQRLQQAEAYVDTVKTFLNSGTRLADLAPDEKQALIERLVASAREALGIPCEKIGVVIESEPFQLFPSSMACVMKFGDAPEISYFPAMEDADALTLLGLNLQECVHVLQGELERVAGDDRQLRLSRDGSDPGQPALQGPLVSRTIAAQGDMYASSLSREPKPGPFYYPTQTDHERDGWMTEVAAKILASHTAEFASDTGPASVYADVSLEMLHKHGPHRILARSAEQRGGFDLKHLAVQIGVRDDDPKSPAPKDPPAAPFAAFQRYLQDKLGDSDDGGTRKLRSEFSTDMLGALSDVVCAAEDPNDPAHHDACLLAAAVLDATGYGHRFPPFDRSALNSFEQLESHCRSQAENLKTPLGRSLLLEFALDHLKEATPEQASALRSAIGA